jgi:hypothetical protein
MPIAADRRALYPDDWEEIRDRLLERAGLRCECQGECGRGHLGRCPEIHLQPSVRPEGRHRIVLSVAHLNHDETDRRDETLRVMCQGCHLHYDVEHHRQTRLQRLHQNRAQLRLIDPPEVHVSQHAGALAGRDPSRRDPGRVTDIDRLYSIAALPDPVRRALLDAIVVHQAAEQQLQEARPELAAALDSARYHGAQAIELAQLAGVSRPRLYRLIDEHRRSTR